MGFTYAQYLQWVSRGMTAQVAAETLFETAERERDLHEQIMAECRRRGFAYIHSRMDKPSRTAAGVADFIVYADKGRVLTIECKSRSGKLRPSQLAFKVQTELQGHRVYIIQTFAEFVNLL